MVSIIQHNPNIHVPARHGCRNGGVVVVQVMAKAIAHCMPQEALQRLDIPKLFLIGSQPDSQVAQEDTDLDQMPAVVVVVAVAVASVVTAG